ncbi:MAG: RdgB/HAM1 family non-canonical purine NTP pyrophosphatase [Oscillospiraceae bacterium]|nr:RdgB/HAM1 family non-canonical purine NTP pyrophosphatase [Oscillospiraceae bacterium]
MELILASNNEKKLKELREILTGMGHTVRSQREAGLDFVVEETGRTFLENARLKARAVVDITGQAAIADDSGLMVEALDGAPGVDSAYYGGDNCKTDQDRFTYLLHQMEGEQNRRAKFVSTIVCIFPDGREMIAQGEWHGELLYAPQGDGGFGYDPIFYVPELEQTAAELSSEQKNRLSHRGKALQEFKKKWEKEYVDQ